MKQGRTGFPARPFFRRGSAALAIGDVRQTEELLSMPHKFM